MIPLPNTIWKQMTKEEQQESYSFLPLYTYKEGDKKVQVHSYNTMLKIQSFHLKMIEKYDKKEKENTATSD